MHSFMKKKSFLLVLLLLSSCGSSTNDSLSVDSSPNSITSMVTSSEETSTSISIHEHTFSDEYDYDETYHWYSSTCNHEEAEEKIKHTFKSEIIDPTYEEEGYTLYTCEECGYFYSDEKTNPLEHNYSSVLSYDENTHWYKCLDEGYEHLKKDEKEHTFTSKVTNPTYEEEGYTTYSCKSCDYYYIDNKTEVLKHNYASVLSYDENTHWYKCIDKGYEHLKKDEESHLFTSKVTNPTYEEEGYTTYSCKSCEYTYKDNYTNPLKHNYSSVLSYDENTHWYKCIDKGYEHLKKNEEEHDFEVIITPSTFLQKGYKTYSCKSCEYSYIDEYLDLLKHSITYHLDGGVNASNNPTSFTVEDEIILSSPTKDGFAFVGWFDEFDNHVYEIVKGTNEDIELYAKWADIFEIQGTKLVSVDGSIPIYKIDIPSGITTIGSNAFSECYYLAAISIPESVIKMEKDAFDGCSYLSSVIYKGTLDKWSQITFDYVSSSPMYVAESFYLIDENNQYSEVKEIELSNNVNEIKDYAFSGFNRVTSVTISKNITKLNYFSFKGCSSLKTISFEEGSKLKTIGESAFYGCSSLEKVDLPSGIETIEDFAFEECEKIESITLPNTLKTIARGAFKNNNSLTSVTIPSGITTIVEHTFAGCNSLLNVVIPNTVKTIEGFSFTGCSMLQKLDIPSSVNTIGSYAFTSCDEIKSIRIPSSVSSIGINAFDECSLAIIYCEAKSKPSGWDTTWNPSFCLVYWGKSSSDIYEKDGVEYIVYNSTGYVSSYLDSNENVVVESSINIKGATYSVTTIGDSAFSSRSNLKTITLPSSITKIEEFAFSGSDIEYIVIPSSVKTIGMNAFYLCFDLVIYCEANGKQTAWDSKWNSQNCPVYYKNEWKYDDNGVPVIIE